VRRLGTAGFTLLEVLIALAVTAIALALGFGAVRESARTSSQLEQTVLAAWALDNAVNALALQAARLEPGKQRSREVLLGREFQINSVIQKLPGAIPVMQLSARVAAAAQAFCPWAA
jgi:type II secretion system protein I